MVRILALLFVLGSSPLAVVAWKSCSEEDGGGVCPDETTCCPTETPGESGCIPLVHTYGPAGKPKGLCCGDASGCRFGYECAVSENSPSEKNIRLGSKKYNLESADHQYCRATHETLVFDQLAKDTPRYNLCKIPEGARKLYGFPVAVTPDPEHPNFTTEDNDIYHLAYLSNVGPITSSQEHSIGEEKPKDHFESIQKAVIVIHGSLRDAEDYFCAGLSLIEDDDSNKRSTMILAPKFASINDHMEEEEESNSRFLVWEDLVYAYNDFLWHIWRYGADAVNAPVSSYAALDGLVEHLVNDKDRFPNLQQITMVGHSAGGQTLQRWSLLSDSPAWNNIDIRVVAANARSYAYLDGRRWLAETSSQSDSNEVFRLPTSNDEVHNHCPWYNHWLWGLEDGGEVFCPYRDTAVEKGGSEAAIAKRYASRDVIYLSGEYDTIPMTRDRCGNAIQGVNRHERALRFYHGLQEYFGNPVPPVHTFRTIPQSNHDHALMLQSQLGRDAILGSSSTISSIAEAATVA